MKKIAMFLPVLVTAYGICMIAGCVTGGTPTEDTATEGGTIIRGGNVDMSRFPFPQHTEYAVAPMMPDNKTQEQMDDIIINLFSKILINDLIVDAKGPQTWEEFRMVFRHTQDWEISEGTINVSHVNVSESQGYGMLITAYMAGSEDRLTLSEKDWIFGCNSLKEYYDAMFRTVMAYPSIIGPHLFCWELFGYPKDGSNKTGYKTVNGVKLAPFTQDKQSGDSATDGDMDIIYSLILADRQWGSDGKYDYIGYARLMLADLWKYCVHDQYRTLLLGDWVKKASNETLRHATRPSDFITSHLKVYKEIDPDHDWQSVIDATYNVIKEIRDAQNKLGNTNGLMPDFAIRGASGWVVPEKKILEADDGSYYYNACRVPWRLGTDYLLYGNTKIGDSSLYDYIIKPLDDFAREFSKGDVNKFGPFYLNGKIYSWTAPDTFTPPLLVTAAANGADQKWVNNFWNYSPKGKWDFKGFAGYSGDTYSDYIKLIVMLTVSGNYWQP